RLADRVRARQRRDRRTPQPAGRPLARRDLRAAAGGGDRRARGTAELGRGAAGDLRGAPRPAGGRPARAAGLRGDLLRLVAAARGPVGGTAPARGGGRGRARGGIRAERRRLGAALARGQRRDARARDRAPRAGARRRVRMRIGIVVPFSWSYWGGV